MVTSRPTESRDRRPETVLLTHFLLDVAGRVPIAPAAVTNARSAPPMSPAAHWPHSNNDVIEAVSPQREPSPVAKTGPAGRAI